MEVVCFVFGGTVPDSFFLWWAFGRYLDASRIDFLGVRDSIFGHFTGAGETNHWQEIVHTYMYVYVIHIKGLFYHKHQVDFFLVPH